MENLTEGVLALAIAVHLSSQGYYVVLQPEIPGKKYRPGVSAIKPRLSELKKRSEKGFIPPEIAYTLGDDDWVDEETIMQETKMDIESLRDLTSKCSGWVESRFESGIKYWRLKDYQVPSRECVMVNCGFENPVRAIRTLRDLKDCCNRAYLVFPFYVDDVFLDHCVESDVGLQVFHPEVGFFKELIPAEFEDIKNPKSYRYLCELILNKNLPYRVEEK